MRPPWEELQLEAASELAVRVAEDPALHEPALLAEARTHGAHLGLVTVSTSSGTSSPWALVALVAERDGAMTPATLNTLVPTDQVEYFSQGSAWWPGPDEPRWLWLVGRVEQRSGAMPRLRLGDASRAVATTRDGWFAHICAAGPGQDALTVEVDEGDGWRPL